MTASTRPLIRIAAIAFCLALPGQYERVLAEPPEAQWADDAAYHRAQAAKYREEAAELQHTIQHYQIMAEVYERGSERATAMNPQGRQRMVALAKRVMQYFSQAKQDLEQLAAEHEEMVKVPHTPPNE
jgi:flagellar biosynthesis/type III secretory pathway protein FliH